MEIRIREEFLAVVEGCTLISRSAPGFKGEKKFSSGISTERNVISVSALAHCENLMESIKGNDLKLEKKHSITITRGLRL